MKGGEVHTQPPYPRRQLGPRVAAAAAGRGWASFYWPMIGVELIPWEVVMVNLPSGGLGCCFGWWWSVRSLFIGLCYVLGIYHRDLWSGSGRW